MRVQNLYSVRYPRRAELINPDCFQYRVSTSFNSRLVSLNRITREIIIIIFLFVLTSLLIQYDFSICLVKA